MLYIDENKLRLQTILLLAQDYGYNYPKGFGLDFDEDDYDKWIQEMVEMFSQKPNELEK